MSSWVNRTVLSGASVNPNGTTSHTCTFTSATSGNLLVAVVAGGVTSSTPAGWTLQQAGVNLGAVYVFTKTASAGESSFTTTHNSSNAPIRGVVYEFNAGSTYVGGNNTTGQSRNVTVTGPAMTGLSGTYTRFAARAWDMNLDTTTSSTAWSVPSIEDYDAFVNYASPIDGITLTIAYDDNQTAASFTPSSVLSADGTTSSGEAVTFVISAVGGSGGGVTVVPPTLISTYNSTYTTQTTPKTLSITTQPGDVVVVYAGSENGGSSDNISINGNSITFTQRQAVLIDQNWATAQIFSGIDSTGGINWTLTASNSTGAGHFWGFSCLVFRKSDGLGTSDKTNVASGAPSLSISTGSDHSAVVVFNNDWLAATTTRTWRTVNSVTPTLGNGLETTYANQPSAMTVYGAYYDDVGAAGANTYGLTAPTGQKYSIVALEVLGQAQSGVSVAWLRA